MCDCYNHKCEKCEKTIPWHIGDFAYNRDEFKLYCEDHINISDIPKNSDEYALYEVNGEIWLAIGPTDDNHPNDNYNVFRLKEQLTNDSIRNFIEKD